MDNHNLYFQNIQFGVNPGGTTSSNTQDIAIYSNLNGQNVIFDNCKFASTTFMTNTLAGTYNGDLLYTFYKFNQTPGDHRVYRPQGDIRIDTGNKIGGNNSLVFNLGITAANALFYEYKLRVSSGKPVTVYVWAKKNANYGAATLPSARLYGLGIDTTQAMTDVNNTWQKLALTGTPNDSGFLTLKIAGQSGTASATCNFGRITYETTDFADGDSANFFGRPEGHALNILYPREIKR
jgi:hypothetical protein